VGDGEASGGGWVLQLPVLMAKRADGFAPQPHGLWPPPAGLLGALMQGLVGDLVSPNAPQPEGALGAPMGNAPHEMLLRAMAEEVPRTRAAPHVMHTAKSVGIGEMEMAPGVGAG
jgi:hypothetical protein